jgi:hypothetical protein
MWWNARRLFRPLRKRAGLAAAWANRCERLSSVGGWQRRSGGSGLLRGSALGWATLDAGRLISGFELVGLLIRFQNGGQIRGDAVAKAEIRLIFAEYHRERNRIEYASVREGLRWIFIVTDDDGADRHPVEAGNAIQGVVAHASGSIKSRGRVLDMFLATFRRFGKLCSPECDDYTDRPSTRKVPPFTVRGVATNLSDAQTAGQISWMKFALRAHGPA